MAQRHFYLVYDFDDYLFRLCFENDDPHFFSLVHKGSSDSLNLTKAFFICPHLSVSMIVYYGISSKVRRTMWLEWFLYEKVIPLCSRRIQLVKWKLLDPRGMQTRMVIWVWRQILTRWSISSFHFTFECKIFMSNYETYFLITQKKFLIFIFQFILLLLQSVYEHLIFSEIVNQNKIIYRCCGCKI